MAMPSLRTKKCPSPWGRFPPRRVWSGRSGKRGVDGETKLVEQDGALRGVPRIKGGPRGARWMTPHTTTPSPPPIFPQNSETPLLFQGLASISLSLICLSMSPSLSSPIVFYGAFCFDTDFGRDFSFEWDSWGKIRDFITHSLGFSSFFYPYLWNSLRESPIVYGEGWGSRVKA